MASMIRVVCIDDNDLVCEAMERKLTRPTFEFLGARPSLEGVDEWIEASRPDVVVLDLEVPGSDPLAWMRRATRSPERPRVVVLSGHLDQTSVREALEAGADGYVSKSEPSGLLVDLLARVAAGERVVSPDVARFAGLDSSALGRGL